MVSVLFEGGLKARLVTFKVALWTALALATAGVAITAGIVAAMFALCVAPPWPYPAWTLALLVGASLAPTDAAAVALLLRRARVAVPERVSARWKCPASTTRCRCS